jgi:drug/metabolite transporter (DMT)-like permease
MDGIRGLPPNTRGALWILLSAVCFTTMTVLIRRLSAYSSPVQAFYGNVAILCVMTPVILCAPRRVLLVNRLGLTVFRSACSVCGVMLYYYAYQKMPLAEANALSFTRALWIAPLAAVLLRERVGLSRWLALAVGFSGVLLIARPSIATPVGWPHLAALLSALLLAMGATGVKMLTRDQGTATILSWTAVLGVLFSAIPAFVVWRWPTLPDLALLVALGFASLAAQLTYIRGMAIGDATALAPVDYSRLVFAVGVGFLLYRETPSLMTVIGTAVIVVATLFVVLQDARRRGAPPVDVI